MLLTTTMSLLCSSPSISTPCTQSSSQLSHLPSITQTIAQSNNHPSQTIQIDLSPNEYINFDTNDTAIYGFGNSSDLTTTQGYTSACPQGSLILGRWIFSKVELLVQLSDDPNIITIGFGQIPAASEAKSYLLYILLVGAGFFLIAVIIILLVNFLPRFCHKNEDSYDTPASGKIGSDGTEGRQTFTLLDKNNRKDSSN